MKADECRITVGRHIGGFAQARLGPAQLTSPRRAGHVGNVRHDYVCS